MARVALKVMLVSAVLSVATLGVALAHNEFRCEGKGSSCRGTAESDKITATANDQRVYGEGGDDTLIIDEEDSWYSRGYTGIDLYGGPGNDHLFSDHGYGNSLFAERATIRISPAVTTT